MNRIYPLLFTSIVLHALHPSIARAQGEDVCPSVFEKAELEKEAIPSEQALRKVVGDGRLYFHTAPDKQCQSRTVFVLPNDRLEAYAEHGEFTEVIFWNAKSRAGTAGWVATARLAEIEAARVAEAKPAVVSSISLRW